MQSLDEILHNDLLDFGVPRLPSASIFEKLAKIDPQLPHLILERAEQIQIDRHQRQFKDLQSALDAKKISIKEHIKAIIQNFSLTYVFTSKAPLPDYTKKIELDGCSIDMQGIGNDLRQAFQEIISEKGINLPLLPIEVFSLEPKI